MNDFRDVINFIEGGLNYDDDLIVIPPGQSRNMRNVVSTDDSNFNVKTNLKGNTLRSTAVGGGAFTYPAGALKVIGFVEDKEDKAGIFFVYSSTGKHSIIKYYSDVNQLEYIVNGATYGSLLNFASDSFIDAVIIGNEDDKQLVWVDGNNNEPRSCLIDSDIYVSSDVLSYYRKPLLSEVNVIYIDTNLNKNNLKGKLFQFAIRKKFLIDNSFSVLSPYTKIPIPQNDENPSGRFTTIAKNNVIAVSFVDPGELNVEYELCYRIIDIGLGAPSDWYISGVKMQHSGISAYFNFTNDETGVLLESTESDRVYDYVPDYANHVATIDSNQVVFGGVTEGYDNMDLDDVDVTLTGSVVTLATFYYTKSATIAHSAPRERFYVTKDTDDDYYYLVVVSGGAQGVFSYANTEGVTDDDVRYYLAAQIGNLENVSTMGSADDYIDVINTTGSDLLVSLFRSKAGVKQPSFKLGSKQFFGIQYLRNGKPFYVTGNTDYDSTNNPFVFDVPEGTGVGYSNRFNNFYYRIKWEINHSPPELATHWQWVYLGNNIDYHEVYLVSKEDDVTHEGDFTLLSKSMISNFRLAYGDDINYGFDIQKGDRIRFSGFFANGDYIHIPQAEMFQDSVFDYEILAVDDDYIKIQNIERESFFDSNDFFYVQAYRFKGISESAGIYQAISPVYEIYTSGENRYHRGDDNDQTAIHAADGYFNSYFGNCFKQYTVFVNESNADEYTSLKSAFGWMENHNASLLYDSNIQSFGKTNILNEFAERRTWNKIRWGGMYLDESGINYMRSFGYIDEKPLDDRNGQITKLEQLGDTLKAYQERKTTSFYLKAKSSVNPDGSLTYVFSNDVMSDGRQSITDYGCTHFSSYVKNVRGAYFFDIINAAVIKDTQGGLVPISDIKMHTYFKDKARAILEYGISDVDILGGWDEDLDMYFITFRVPGDSQSSINETIGFFESKDRWECFCDFIPEYYGKISGFTALAFHEGTLYTQNTNSTRNNFFGVQYGSIIDVIAKGDPSVVKTWESISIISNGQWSPSTNGDIEITIPSLMQSRLVAGKFKQQEGIYKSEFLRNALDGNSNFVRNRLQTGHVLRGNVVRVRLRNSDTSEANIRMVIINSKVSDNG